MFYTGGKRWYKEYVEFKKNYPNITTLTEYKNQSTLPMGGTRRQRKRTRRNRFF